MSLKYEPASEPLHIYVKGALTKRWFLVPPMLSTTNRPSQRSRICLTDRRFPFLYLERVSSLLTTYWSESTLPS